jgi:hypothetical protein
MNRKANMLAEQTLKIVIATLSLLLLLYLLFALYSNFTQKQNFARADATLQGLDGKMIDARNNNEKQAHVLLEPNGWILTSYTSGEKPDECSDNCICLCEAQGTGSWKRAWIWAQNQIEKCNLRGTCKDYSENLNDFEIEIDDETDVEIEFNGGKYEITKK